FYCYPGNIHDSQQLIPLIEKLKNTLSTPLVVVVNAGYKTPIIAKHLWSQDIEAVLPYTRPKGKEGLFSKRTFLYNHYLDSYLCPNEALLSYVRTTRDGYLLYKSNSLHCSCCSLLKNCTQNKQKEKILLRHLWEPYLEVSEELRYTEQHKKWYKRKKETIERCFADTKEKHG
ncbi:IS5/IS1182 family transposase, partial [Listeria ivanovii]|uniref:transposase n=1 Tax=Listeria ivanovii TaxID=1638 RepID=UPI000DC26300